MSKFWYLPALDSVLRAQLNVATADVRIKLAMTNHTCIVDRATAQYLQDITDVDEYDGGGYTEITATGVALSLDAADLRIELHVDQDSWGSAVAQGTRQAGGYLVYEYVDGVADPLLGFSDEGGFPLDGAGGPFTLTPDIAAGLLTLA